MVMTKKEMNNLCRDVPFRGGLTCCFPDRLDAIQTDCPADKQTNTTPDNTLEFTKTPHGIFQF